MKLVDQWLELEDGLPENWQEVRLSLRVESKSDLPRAAAVLGPLGAGRSDDALVLTIGRGGGNPRENVTGPEAARRQFRKLDGSRTWCQLELLDVVAATAGPDAAPRTPIAASWDTALATLPADWSDLLCELELDSSDYLPRAALLCAPINPTRDMSRIGFVFRCARRAGYGVSPAMARRCFERCAEEGITGRASIVRVLSDTDNVATQGAVWYVGGRVL